MAAIPSFDENVLRQICGVVADTNKQPDEIIAVAKHGYEAYKIKWERGLQDSAGVCIWSRRWMVGESETALDDAARILIREAYAKRADEIVSASQVGVNRGVETLASLYTAQYYALQAHQELDAAKHKSGKK